MPSRARVSLSTADCSCSAEKAEADTDSMSCPVMISLEGEEVAEWIAIGLMALVPIFAASSVGGVGSMTDVCPQRLLSTIDCSGSGS